MPVTPLSVQGLQAVPTVASVQVLTLAFEQVGLHQVPESIATSPDFVSDPFTKTRSTVFTIIQAKVTITIPMTAPVSIFLPLLTNSSLPREIIMQKPPITNIKSTMPDKKLANRFATPIPALTTSQTEHVGPDGARAQDGTKEAEAGKATNKLRTNKNKYFFLFMVITWLILFFWQYC